MKSYSTHLKVYSPSLHELANAYGLAMLISEAPDEFKRIEGLAYLCPLCLEHYIYEQGEELKSNDKFSLDHFPPDSVGGKQVALVCKPCNNTYGIEIDYTLKKYLSFRRFISKKDNSSYPVRLKGEDLVGSYRIQLGWEGHKFVQYVPFRKYPLIKKWLIDPREEWSFQFTIMEPAEIKVNRAILKVAYLQCFSKWGYDFAFSETAEVVRAIIAGIDPYSNIDFGVYQSATDVPPAGLYQIKLPADFRCFVVFIEMTLSDPDFSEKVFVLIPGKQTDTIGEFARLKKLSLGRNTFTLVSCNQEYVRQEDFWAYSRLSAKWK